MSDHKDRALHIAMYPWYGISHMTSNLHLANKLANRGHRVSLLLPPNSQAKLASHNYHPNLITIIPISVPHVDSLPLGAETPNDLPRSAIPLLATAMDLTRDTVRAHLARLEPDFVLFDFAHWMPELARELGIKSVYYNTGLLVRIAYFLHDVPVTYMFTKAELLEAPSGFPSKEIRLQPYEARVLAAVFSMDFGGLPFWERLTRGTTECDAVGSKTCREMEAHYADFMEKHFGKPVILAGPVIPEPLASTLNPQLDEWLKGFPEDSVIYCALGSECVLDEEQFQQIVLGLELTGRPFLAALKPPKGYESIESALPEGFTERIKGRGMIHSGWVQQQLILKHASVGCFITHGGSGSISEAMTSKCQLVMMPQGVDQFINAKFLSLELRVGVEVQRRDEDGVFTKEAISKAVSSVMENESEVGRQMRSNHAKWTTILDQALGESYIDSFIQNLRNLLG